MCGRAGGTAGKQGEGLFQLAALQRSGGRGDEARTPRPSEEKRRERARKTKTVWRWQSWKTSEYILQMQLRAF